MIKEFTCDNTVLGQICGGHELRADVIQSCRVVVDAEGRIICNDNFTDPEIDEDTLFCADCGALVNRYTLSTKTKK